MSADAPERGRSAVAAALSAVADWLVEPTQQPPTRPAQQQPVVQERAVIAVVGLQRRIGVSTVARALGAELASRDPSGACAVTGQAGGGVMPLGLPAASRLARALGPVGAGRTRTCGRLCLVDTPEQFELCTTLRFLAPLVIDVADPVEAAGVVTLADGVVLVCAPKGEPALAAVVAGSLARVGPAPVIVVNRGKAEADGRRGVCSLVLPESRMGAQRARAGREPRGPLGRGVAELADSCQGHRSRYS